jgi:hypothetical protein
MCGTTDDIPLLSEQQLGRKSSHQAELHADSLRYWQQPEGVTHALPP